MKRIAWMFALVTIFGFVVGMTTLQAQANLPEAYKDRYTKDLFDAADADHDGHISLSEAQAATKDVEQGLIGKKRFGAADRNNDGVLSFEEARSYRFFEVTHREELGQNAKHRTGRKGGDVVSPRNMREQRKEGMAVKRADRKRVVGEKGKAGALNSPRVREAQKEKLTVKQRIHKNDLQEKRYRRSHQDRIRTTR